MQTKVDYMTFSIPVSNEFRIRVYGDPGKFRGNSIYDEVQYSASYIAQLLDVPNAHMSFRKPIAYMDATLECALTGALYSMLDRKGHRTLHVSLSSACLNWVRASDVLELLQGHSGRLTRLDVALDEDTQGEYSAAVKQRALAGTPVDGISPIQIVGNEVSGLTVYVRGRGSNSMWRVYDKGKQTGGNPDWVRWELQLSRGFWEKAMPPKTVADAVEIARQAFMRDFPDCPVAMIDMWEFRESYLETGRFAQGQALAGVSWLNETVLGHIRKAINSDDLSLREFFYQVSRLVHSSDSEAARVAVGGWQAGAGDAVRVD